MKAVLLSIQPKWCELIARGKKTIEVRKTRPKIETPFKCYIYMTATKERCRLWEYITAYQNSKGDILNGSQKVIGEFVCDRIVDIKINSDDCGNYWHEWNDECDIEDMCLSYEELETYLGKFIGYGWHISDLKIYDKPRELGEFWLYNDELNKRYEHDENFCCYDGTDENGEATTDCDGENINNCYLCWEEWSGWCHKLTRPPQSWCYVEEI